MWIFCCCLFYFCKGCLQSDRIQFTIHLCCSQHPYVTCATHYISIWYVLFITTLTHLFYSSYPWVTFAAHYFTVLCVLLHLYITCYSLQECNSPHPWPLLVWQCTFRSTNPQSRFVIISFLLTVFFEMHCLHFAVYLILSGIRVCDLSEPIMHSGHPVVIESGIHPCVDSINFAYLAFQGHCRRVTHSFRNVSPWTSLLLALSGDISLNPGPGSRSLNGCLLNVRSIRNKSASFLEFVKDNNADLIAITETWLRPEDTESFISSITPPGYKFPHVPRNIKKGGGVGFFIKEDLSYEQVSKNKYQAFESISIQISSEGAKDVIFHVVYRPPNLSKSQFLDEFGMFLEGAALSGYENILLGDLNFHLDKHDTWTLKFYDILEQFGFTQLVNAPTHIQGHILDALCVRDSFSWAISPKVIGGLSDHQAIIFSLIFPVRESCKFQRVPIRIHKINISNFRMGILKSDLIRCPYKTASLLSHQYFNTLRSLLDRHAPIMKKKYTKTCWDWFHELWHPQGKTTQEEILAGMASWKLSQ